MDHYLQMFSSELQQLQASNRQLYAKIDSAQAILQQMMQENVVDPYSKQPPLYQATPQPKRQSWTDQEHVTFLRAYFYYTREQPKLIQQAVGSRDIRQVYSHIYKYEMKLYQFNDKATEFAQKHCAFVANHLAACSVQLPARLTPAYLAGQILYPGYFTNACVQFYTCKQPLAAIIAERADAILASNFAGIYLEHGVLCEAYQAFWMLSHDYVQASGLILKFIKLLELFETQSYDTQEFIVLNASRMLGVNQDEIICLWRCVYIICAAGTFKSQ